MSHYQSKHISEGTKSRNFAAELEEQEEIELANEVTLLNMSQAQKG